MISPCRRLALRWIVLFYEALDREDMRPMNLHVSALEKRFEEWIEDGEFSEEFLVRLFASWLPLKRKDRHGPAMERAKPEIRKFIEDNKELAAEWMLVRPVLAVRP